MRPDASHTTASRPNSEVAYPPTRSPLAPTTYAPLSQAPPSRSPSAVRPEAAVQRIASSPRDVRTHPTTTLPSCDALAALEPASPPVSVPRRSSDAPVFHRHAWTALLDAVPVCEPTSVSPSGASPPR